MTAPWVRPTNWDAPGLPKRGGDDRKILDALDRLAQGAVVGATYKSSATSVDSGTGGTTYQNDPHLSFEVEALEVVRVKLEIVFDAGTTGDLKSRFLLPSGQFTSGKFQTTGAPQALSDGNGEVTGIAGAGVGAGLCFMFWGTLEVGSTGGTVNWQWAQNASDANDTTVRRGGYLQFVRIGFAS